MLDVTPETIDEDIVECAVTPTATLEPTMPTNVFSKKF